MTMIKRMVRMATVLGAVSASLALGVGNSHADLGLRIDFGNNGTWDSEVHDNLAGDLNAALGTLLMNASSGAVTLDINAGLSKPAIGSPTNPKIDLSTVLYTSGATELRIQLSDTSFDGLAVAFGQLVSIGGTISGMGGAPIPGSWVETNIYRDLANTQFINDPSGRLICSTGHLFANIFDAFSGGCGAYTSLDDEYSITMETIIHLSDAGVVSYDAHYRLGSRGEIDVPEPASMMLLGFGAIGLGAWRRRRKVEQN